MLILLLVMCAAVLAQKTQLVLQLKDNNAVSHAVLGQLAHQLRFSYESVVPPSYTQAEIDASPLLRELASFYTVTSMVPDQQLYVLRSALLRANGALFSSIFVKPVPELAVLTDESTTTTTTEGEKNADPTPLFRDRQLYLNKAPEGVEQDAVFNVTGGRGDGVQVLDVELGWDLDHEALIKHNGKVVVGYNSRMTAYKDHGTAVISEVSGVYSNFGVTGIAPNVNIMAASIENKDGSFNYPNCAKIVLEAAKFLKKGDVMIIELHAPCPNGGKYVAMEYWYDNYLAFKYIGEQLGIVIVEAAGNGNANFDDKLYDRRPTDFPEKWKNPFRRENGTDSTAVLVGAGAPPKGRWGTDRSRLSFSNYGSAVDAQGYGRDVCACGYGDLFGRSYGRSRYYTAQFSGTSSATPIVAGVVASVQGIVKAMGKDPLDSFSMRNLLRSTGSPQQGNTKERIGNRPNLRELYERIQQLKK